jgi:uncharacterized protein YcgI (DUF1989 family)
MSQGMLEPSKLDPDDAVFDRVVEAGNGFTHVIRQGEIFRIVDLEGNQAVDTLFTTQQIPSNATARSTPFASRATSI